MTLDLFAPARDEEVVAVGPLRALRWTARDLRAPQRFLLVHDFWTGAHIWRLMGPYLARHGYTTDAVWLRHHHPGAHHDLLGDAGIGAYADDVAAAVEDVGQPIVVGHGVGGLVVQRAAARRNPIGLGLMASLAPDLVSMLLGGSLPRRLWRAGVLRPFGPPLIPPLEGDPAGAQFAYLDPELARELGARGVPEPRRAARQFAFGGARVSRGDIRCPVLVLGGSEDRAVTPLVAHRLAARYRVVAHLYPGRGHMLQLESGWESIADALMLWADRFVE